MTCDDTYDGCEAAWGGKSSQHQVQQLEAMRVCTCGCMGTICPPTMHATDGQNSFKKQLNSSI